jgi:hypothetical protein
VDVPLTVYQLGFDDRLTKYRKQIALNFLKTIQKAIAREKETGIFPSAMVHEVFAEAHGWIAEEMFKAGDNAGLRKHSLLSVRHKPAQPRQVSFFAYSLVPRMVSDGLLSGYRNLKAKISGYRGVRANIFL